MAEASWYDPKMKTYYVSVSTSERIGARSELTEKSDPHGQTATPFAVQEVNNFGDQHIHRGLE